MLEGPLSGRCFVSERIVICRALSPVALRRHALLLVVDEGECWLCDRLQRATTLEAAPFGLVLALVEVGISPAASASSEPELPGLLCRQHRIRAPFQLVS